MTTVKVSAELNDINGNPLSNKTIKFYRSNDGETYNLIATETTNENGVAEITDEITSPGEYYYKAVFPGDDTYDASQAVTTYTEKEPHFTIVDINYPSSVTAGSTINVGVVIANDGDVNGIATVHVYHGTELVATKSVNVVAGSTTTASLSWMASTVPGNYDYEIRVINNSTGNLDAMQTITIEVTGGGQPPSGGKTTESWLEKYGWVILLLLLVLVLVLVLRGRK